MESCPITDFFTKYPLPLHFNMFTMSQCMELRCWDWTQCLHLFELFQNRTLFSQLGVTCGSFWLTYEILSNYRFSYQIPPTPLFSNGRHFSMDWARMLRLDSMSLSFPALSESFLFCSIWCNRRLILTYIWNPVNFQIFLPNTPYPPFSNGHHFSTDGARMLRLDSMSLSFQALSESYLFCSIWWNRRLVLT